MKVTRFLVTLGLVLVFVLLGFVPAVQGVKEYGLDSYGKPYEVNSDSLGKVYVSDADAGKIWRLDPALDTYMSYQVSRSVRDAQKDSSGRIWWADGSGTFGYVSTPMSYQWTLSADPPYYLQALAPDDQGGVWLGEADGGGDLNNISRLFYFKPSENNKLCTYILPYGAFTHDIIFKDGYLWLGQWSQGQIYRIEPGSNSIAYTFWQEESTYGPWGIAVDGNYVWWADYFQNAIARLNTVTNIATFYSLPVGSSPRMITVNNNKAWYTEEYANEMSILNPATASGNDIELAVYTDPPLPGNCTNLGSAASSYIQVVSGNLSWNDSAASISYDQDGWRIYELPAGARLYGVAGSAGHVWAADQDRHLLLRFDAQTSIYLPLIRKR